MKRILPALFIIFSAITASAQLINVSQQQISFANTDELSTDSALLYVSYTFSAQSSLTTVEVTDINFYSTYGRPAFSVSDTAFAINVGDSVGIYVRFHPRHNIMHNSEMVIENNGMRGYKTVDLLGQGTYTKSYYTASQNQEEQQLKQALSTIISTGYVSLSYNAARDNMYSSIDNYNGYVTCVYTTDSAQFTTRPAATAAGFDCEHTFPQGFFNQAVPMRSDIHHLYPTKQQANNSRGSLPFGVASAPYQQVSNNAPSRKGSNGLYEPHDGQKGATARAMLYFVVRYQDYNNFFASQEAILKQWNNDFLPDLREINRNTDIFQLQNNRNPFVDYPQFAERITNFVGTSAAPTANSLDYTQDTIDFGNVGISTPISFNYELVNKGNTTLFISNPAVTSAALTVTNPATQLVQPGESIQLDIQLNSSQVGAFAEMLTFNINASGYTDSAAIPVVYNSVIASMAKEFESTPKFTVWPNPAQREIHISSDQSNAQLTEVKLYDLIGQEVLGREIQLNGHEQSVNLDGLKNGIYILRIKNASYAKTIKLIKQ